MQTRYSAEEHLAELTQKAIGFILIMGALLFPVLEFMDYFVLPGKFAQFMIYRLAVSALLVLLYFLNRLKRSKPYQFTIATLGAVFSAVTVELAVLQSGGQISTYYAAMMILTICCLGFAPINMVWSFILVGLVYVIYTVPILLSGPITSGVFVSNNAFLIATFVIGLLLRYNNQKILLSELSLRAELFEDKRKLEVYSSSLQDQVEETSGALARTEQKYRALFDNANDGIAVMDRHGNMTDINYRFCELHGFDCGAILDTNYRLLEIEKNRGEIEDRFRRILSGESLVYEAEHYRKDGSRILLEISSRAIEIGGDPYIQSFHRDITEKVKLQEHVLQSQKMESMGMLAGAISHDFKNVLTGILAHTEVLRRHVKTDDFGKRRIKTIEDAAVRANQLISKLLSFARKESLELVPTDLNAVVTDSIELLGRALLDENVKIRIQLDRELPAITGDAIHLEQVITNLVMNARDAMPSGGVVAISTRRSELNADSPLVSRFLPPGSYVVLSVSDRGSGIPRHIIDRIFDPFFTTKPAGKGTGLGLAMVYGIVKSHSGEIRVTSTENEGSIFDLYFPVPEQMPACRIQAGAAADSARPGILVVARIALLAPLCAILEEEGYVLFSAESPIQGLEMVRMHQDRIDMLIAEAELAGMSVVELAASVRKTKPAIKVIVVSENGPMQHPDIDIVLTETVRKESLLEGIRKALSGPPRDAASRA